MSLPSITMPGLRLPQAPEQTGLPLATLWERVATTRWGAYISEIERRLICRGAELAGEPTVALEIGCEGGRWCKLLADMGWCITCTDVDAVALEICRQKVPQAQRILAQPTDQALPVAAGSASLLLCIEVAPVMQSGWFPAEARRVLAPGGILVGVFWNRLSWRGLQARLRLRFHRGKGGDFYRNSYRAWKERTEKNGFRMVYEEGFCWAPFGRSSNSPLVPAFTRAERLTRLNRAILVSPWIGFIAQKE